MRMELKYRLRRGVALVIGFGFLLLLLGNLFISGIDHQVKDNEKILEEHKFIWEVTE